MRIAAWYKTGLTPEEIAAQYGHLSLAQVHAALAYYHANSDEIEADLAQEDAFAETIERERWTARAAKSDCISTRTLCNTLSLRFSERVMSILWQHLTRA